MDDFDTPDAKGIGDSNLREDCSVKFYSQEGCVYPEQYQSEKNFFKSSAREIYFTLIKLILFVNGGIITQE